MNKMSEIDENVEVAGIPSDGESDDDIENSEDEYSRVEDGLPVDSMESDDQISYVNRNEYDEYDEYDDIPLSSRVAKTDGIWENKSRCQYNPRFSERSGPKNFPESIDQAGEIFLCLFSEQNIKLIVEQSNLYCQQKGSVFEPITIDEVKKFLGLNILMGIKRLPSYRDYWSTNPQLHDYYISSLMSVKRFSFLLSHLHLNDITKEPKRDEPNYDKLYKVAPFLSTLSKTFQYFYDPSMNQSIDESMIKFKGRSTMKQYMPMKPIKRGYKIWVRSDEYGYICEFQIYTGKIKNNPERMLGERVVKDLTRSLIHKHYHIYFDNFFTTVNLMKSLLADGILACGTIRRDRKGLPKTQKAEKNMSPGDSEFRTSFTGLRWLKWIDKKPVFFLSNYHDPSVITEVSRRQKDGSLKMVSCPLVAKDYNIHMGYVDKADMLKSFYEINRKSKKWWHRIFWHFVDVTTVNSCIIYRLLFPEKKTLLKDFRLSVADHLIGASNPPKKGRPSLNSSLKAKWKVTPAVRTTPLLHIPCVLESRRRCTHCSTKVHEKRTTFYCKTCNVPLCIDKGQNCFEKFHAKK